MILKQGYVPPENTEAVLYQTVAFKCTLVIPKPLRHITAGIHFCGVVFNEFVKQRKQHCQFPSHLKYTDFSE